MDESGADEQSPATDTDGSGTVASDARGSTDTAGSAGASEASPDATAGQDTTTGTDTDPTAGAATSTVAGEDATASAASGAPASEDWVDTRWVQFAPSTPRPPGPLGRAVRRFGRFWIHEWTLVWLGGIALAVGMFWPSVRHPATTIPADIWDPTLVAWSLSWPGHILTTDPSQLWNSNAFYPDLYSFTFTDTLLGYFPASLVGTGPTAALIRYNMLFLFAFTLAFVGMYALVRQLGASRIGGAVAGVGLAYAPWHWAQSGHLHVISLGGIPLSLAMLARGHGVSLVRGRTRPKRPGWAFLGWLTAAWQITIGFSIGLPFGYVLGGICLVSIIIWLVRGRPAPGRRLLLADIAGVVIFGGVAAFMARPYFQVIKLHPEARRSVEYLKVFSPHWHDFFVAPEKSLPWGAAHAAARATMNAPAETTLLPGFILMALAIAGLFFSAWTLRTRIFLFVGLAASVVLALGTNFFGGTYTYVVLFTYLPGWESGRTPGRLVIWTTIVLAALAAGTLSGLSQRSQDVADERVPARPGLALNLALLIPLALVLAEGTTTLDHPVVPAQPAAMRTVDGPLLVLPSDPLTDSNIMLWSTTKFQKMVNGNSGFTPTDQDRTRQIAKSFPDQTSVDYLRRLGIKEVIVVKGRATGGDYAKAASPTAPIDGLGITRVDDGESLIYTLN